MQDAIRGKKIWLIGASEGIGKALAQALAKQGAVLALCARQKDRLEEIAKPLGAMVAPADVTDAPSLAQAYATIKAAWGLPDVVIYNAGIYEPMTAQQFNLPQVEKMMNVNFSGALRVLHHVLPDFIAAHQGHIVLVSSIAAYRGLPGAIGYGASKAALTHLAENMAIDLYGTGIKLQIVSPGFVRTRLTDKNDFAMPQIMEPEQAAAHIVRGMQSKTFDIRFPFVFANLLKALSFLPARLYIALMRSHAPKT